MNRAACFWNSKTSLHQMGNHYWINQFEAMSLQTKTTQPKQTIPSHYEPAHSHFAASMQKKPKKWPWNCQHVEKNSLSATNIIPQPSRGLQAHPPLQGENGRYVIDSWGFKCVQQIRDLEETCLAQSVFFGSLYNLPPPPPIINPLASPYAVAPCD